MYKTCCPQDRGLGGHLKSLPHHHPARRKRNVSSLNKRITKRVQDLLASVSFGVLPPLDISGLCILATNSHRCGTASLPTPKSRPVWVLAYCSMNPKMQSSRPNPQDLQMSLFWISDGSPHMQSWPNSSDQLHIRREKNMAGRSHTKTDAETEAMAYRPQGTKGGPGPQEARRELWNHSPIP